MEAEEMSTWTKMMITLVISTGALMFTFYVYNVTFAKFKRGASMLKKQGIRGPPPSFLFGNIPDIKRIHMESKSSPIEETNSTSTSTTSTSIAHNWPVTVFPHLHNWIQQYGPTFLYSTGSISTLCTIDVELVKELSLCMSLNLGKPSYLSKDRGPLLGESILSANGPSWTHQRKIIAPEFYIDRVNRMLGLMVDSALLVVESWERRIEENGGRVDIDINPDMKCLSADIISRACFGSNYVEGEEIFVKLRALRNLMSKGHIGIPGSRHLPTKTNRGIWKLEAEINSMILNVVKLRAAAGYEKDLLQMIMDGARSSKDDGDGNNDSVGKIIVDNCKAIYFAGHDTSAITASWCLMLLAANPEWQTRTRAEVLKMCGAKLPDAHMLRNMKTLTMVIQETLRLYPPATFIVREALQDMQFKNLVIPKGMNIQIPIPILQQNPEIWGADAHKFNPERFANGVLGATGIPQAYMPFGAGPRICAGQHFAMAELKVILSLILSKFSFSLSPSYCHMPVFRLIAEPGEGVNLCVERLPAP